jgi:hypothetical protein
MDYTQQFVTIICMVIYAYIWFKLGFYRGWTTRGEFDKAFGR